MVFALIGNQNCGKTTLFNQLTGSNQHVGNFPGVTVEKKEGIIRKHSDMTVVDLPGIYSLSPYTAEEIVTRDFLIREKPDGIINILDATNIERNLYLSLQLMELNIPMILALNMMDEVTASGNTIDISSLSKQLGCDIVPISASRNEGIAELVSRLSHLSPPKRLDFCTGEVHKAIHSIAHIIENDCRRISTPVRFAATKVVEGDEVMLKSLQLSAGDQEILRHIVDDMEAALGTDREAALADMRYSYIEALVSRTVVKQNRQTREQQRSVKMDAVLTHKYLAIPIFITIMGMVFFLTFEVFGGVLSDWMDLGIQFLTQRLDILLTGWGINSFIHSLIIDGICAGVGSVLSFLPIIVILFFFLSMLEDTGYMARVAFVMDKLLRKIGLSGRSFVPMLIGFGCSVPAIMATRTLPSERDRRMTIMLTPYMSCSAKLPIYAAITQAFFPGYGGLVMLSLYILGMVVAILLGLLLKTLVFKGEPVPFVMELPAYRLPSLKTIVLHMWEKAADFLKRAFTIIFIASVAIWLLQNLDFQLNLVADVSDSVLASVGRVIAPVFQPLGFGDWRAVTALLTGLTAKEAVISTLTVLCDGVALTGLFSSGLAAYTFLVFTLLYMPCVAAFAAIRREVNSLPKSVGMMIFQTATAWSVAFLVYQIGGLIVHGLG